MVLQQLFTVQEVQAVLSLLQPKQGKKGTAVIDYNVYVTAEMVAKHTDVMNATEWRALRARNRLRELTFGYDTDWFKEITQTAYSQVHNISMSGGSDKTTYRASVNYRDTEGVMRTTGLPSLTEESILHRKQSMTSLLSI